jgi:hypothetical protein
MGLLVRLLNPKTARAFLDLMMGIWVFAQVFVGDFNLDRFQRWLWGAPPRVDQKVVQENEVSSAQVEAVFVLFQHYMDTQFEVDALRRQMLTFPALPDENY